MSYINCIHEPSTTNATQPSTPVLNLDTQNENINIDINVLLSRLMNKLSDILMVSLSSNSEQQINYHSKLKALNKPENQTFENLKIDDLINELFSNDTDDNTKLDYSTVIKLINSLNTQNLLSQSAVVHTAVASGQKQSSNNDIQNEAKNLYIKRLLLKLLQAYGAKLYQEKQNSSDV